MAWCGVAKKGLPLASTCVGAYFASLWVGGFPEDTLLGSYFEGASLFLAGCGLCVEAIDAMFRLGEKE